jgi:hypothetical protein
MARFFEQHFPGADPIVISEAEARATGTYSEEIDEPGVPRHLRVYLDHQLLRITYPDAEPSAEIAQLQRTRYPGVASWITSPAVKEEGTSKYSIWYVEEDAAVGKRVDYENSERLAWSRWYHPDGSYGGAMERLYDENGDSLEVREHLPDGRVLVIDD